MTFREEMAAAATEYGLTLSERQLQQFARYNDLLLEWNQKMNLTAITAPREVAVKHMIDSLAAYDEDWFQGVTTIVDVGTGAGFPGLPLKIFRPSLRLTLIDALAKRVRFLEEVTAALDLADVVCVHARAEEAARQKTYRERFDIAVSRAVASLPVLAEYTLPFVKPGGCFLALKGAKYQEETKAAQNALTVLGGCLAETRPIHLPGLTDTRAILCVRKEKPTPAAYPRKAGTPEKKPL